jgi:hypothetical protein
MLSLSKGLVLFTLTLFPRTVEVDNIFFMLLLETELLSAAKHCSRLLYVIICFSFVSVYTSDKNVLKG